MDSRRQNQVDLEIFGLASHYGQHGGMAHSHRHNEIEINFIEQGSMTYFIAGAEVTVTAQQLALFWAAIPHQVIRSDDPTNFYWVTLPLGTFLGWDMPLQQTLLNGQLIIDQQPLAPAVDHQLVQQWYADLKSLSRERQAITLLEIEARLRRLALRLAETVNMPVPAAHSGAAAQMAHFINAHFREPLSIGDVAQVVGLHRNYAMTIFKAAFGVSILAYLTQHRISYAQRLLITSEESITDIAYEAGFGSLSQFYSAFVRLCGQPPKQYRASLQAFRQADGNRI